MDLEVKIILLPEYGLFPGSYQLPCHTYVCCTDVKGYFAHIDHTQLMDKLSEEIKEPYLRRLLDMVVSFGGHLSGKCRLRSLIPGTAMSVMVTNATNYPKITNFRFWHYPANEEHYRNVRFEGR